MQLFSLRPVDGFRIVLFIVAIVILFISTKRSSKTVVQAKRLPLIYPGTDEVSPETIEREATLRKLSRRWKFYTVIDFSLASMLFYEFAKGVPAADLGLLYYVTIHLPTTVLISFAIGLFVSGIAIRYRSPFRTGLIGPVGLLLNALESLLEAAKPEEGGGQGYVDSILLRIVAQEIERFMENRKMGDTERGKLLEYLSHHEGVIGEVASSLLWPLEL
ncbi:MAG: hypothetical protein ACFFAZ_13730 [Promethearchaeota archaeon]